MAEFVFTSPGVKFKERDLSFVTRNVGVTTLGLVGETEKGPAFEPVFVEDAGQFRDRFGNQNVAKFPNGKLQYELPYVANAYLEESNQLWVTRVLGLSGYDAGTAWAITLNAGVDPATAGVSGAVVAKGTGLYARSTNKTAAEKASRRTVLLEIFPKIACVPQPASMARGRLRKILSRSGRRIMRSKEKSSTRR